MGEEENDYATKQSSLLMRSSDHLSTFKLLNEINVTSTSTSEFECSSYFCQFNIKFSFLTFNFQVVNCSFSSQFKYQVSSFLTIKIQVLQD